MIGVLDDFRAKVREVNLFIRYLELTDDASSEICVARGDDSKKFPIDRDFAVILRANAFLLLYNLMEATVCDLVEELCAGMNRSRVCFEDASNEVQKTWLHAKVRNLKEASPETWVEELADILRGVANREGITFHFEQVLHATAGNVDARKMREIAAQFGFSCQSGPALKGGEKLHVVKTKRNALAHGDLSFVECGRDYQVREIVAIKRQVIAFLWSLLKSARVYVERDQFRRHVDQVMI